jgi:hypothetical protein
MQATNLNDEYNEKFLPDDSDGVLRQMHCQLKMSST